jgi:hypothetical protein
MLPAVALNARIMRYGYQSRWFGEVAVRLKASTVAQRILIALQRQREVQMLYISVVSWLIPLGVSVLAVDLHGALLRRASGAQGRASGVTLGRTNI